MVGYMGMFMECLELQRGQEVIVNKKKMDVVKDKQGKWKLYKPACNTTEIQK